MTSLFWRIAIRRQRMDGAPAPAPASKRRFKSSADVGLASVLAASTSTCLQAPTPPAEPPPSQRSKRPHRAAAAAAAAAPRGTAASGEATATAATASTGQQPAKASTSGACNDAGGEDGSGAPPPVQFEGSGYTEVGVNPNVGGKGLQCAEGARGRCALAPCHARFSPPAVMVGLHVGVREAVALVGCLYTASYGKHARKRASSGDSPPRWGSSQVPAAAGGAPQDPCMH